jgi:hypothetical protein
MGDRGFNFSTLLCLSITMPVIFLQTFLGGQRPLVALLLLSPSFFSDYSFWVHHPTTLLTGMTGNSLHMQWPLTSQSHGSVSQRQQLFFGMDQTPCPYPTRSLPAQLWHLCMEWSTVWVSIKPWKKIGLAEIWTRVSKWHTGALSTTPRAHAPYFGRLWDQFFSFLKNISGLIFNYTRKIHSSLHVQIHVNVSLG